MKTATQSSSLERGLSWPVLVLSHFGVHTLEQISGEPQAFEYKTGKDCYGLCIFKKGHSSTIVLAMAFVLDGLPKGDVRSMSQLPGHSADDSRRRHLLSLLLPRFLQKSGWEKFEEWAPFLDSQQSERRENLKGRIEGAGIGERGAVSDKAEGGRGPGGGPAAGVQGGEPRLPAETGECDAQRRQAAGGAAPLGARGVQPRGRPGARGGARGAAHATLRPTREHSPPGGERPSPEPRGPGRAQGARSERAGAPAIRSPPRDAPRTDSLERQAGGTRLPRALLQQVGAEGGAVRGPQRGALDQASLPPGPEVRGTRRSPSPRRWRRREGAVLTPASPRAQPESQRGEGAGGSFPGKGRGEVCARERRAETAWTLDLARAGRRKCRLRGTREPLVATGDGRSRAVTDATAVGEARDSPSLSFPLGMKRGDYFREQRCRGEGGLPGCCLSHSSSTTSDRDPAGQCQLHCPEVLETVWWAKSRLFIHGSLSPSPSASSLAGWKQLGRGSARFNGYLVRLWKVMELIFLKFSQRFCHILKSCS